MWQKDIWVDVLEYLESPDCSEFSGSAAVAYHSALKASASTSLEDNAEAFVL